MSVKSVAVSRASGAGALVLSACMGLSLGCKSAPNSMEVVRDTTRAWDSDNYIPPTDPRGVRKNAARVLAMPETPQQRVMTVGSKSAVVFSEPSVRAKPVGVLKAGDAVRVTMAADFVRIAPEGKPDFTAGAMSEYVADSKGKSSQVVTPSWVAVDTGSVKGWVPARSLTDPVSTATASSNMILAREAEADGSGAKGFSSRMKVRSTAMKGGMGDVQVKDANFLRADELLARCTVPPDLNVSDRPAFTAVPRLESVPHVGRPLYEVDPALQIAVSEESMRAAAGGAVGEAAKKVGQAAGFLSDIGIGGDTASNIQQGAKAIEAVAPLLSEHPLTAEEERMISRQCLAQTVGNTPVLDTDHPVSAYVNWVGAWVVAQSTLPYPASGFEVVVLQDPSTINAMAIPGGPIVITTGMLAFLESEDELAFLLGHEMAHVEERHGFKQLNDNKLIRKLASLISLQSLEASGQLDPLLNKLFDKCDVPANLRAEGVAWLKSQIKELPPMIANAISEGILSVTGGADQGIETAADLRGLSLTAAAGYNPAAAEALLTRFKDYSGSYGGSKYSGNRLEEARSVITKLPSRDGGMCKTLDEQGGTVTPSAQATANWQRLDAELSKN